MEALHFEARGTFGVTPEQLWPLVADTPRLNRAIGLPPIEYEVTPAPGGGSHVEAAVRVLGVTVARWTEHPFRWEAPHGYVVVREFHGGPLQRVRGGAQLTPRDGGTEVRVFADIQPRNVVGALLTRLAIGPRNVRGVLAQCRLFERHLLGEAPDPFPQLAPRRALPPDEGLRARLLVPGADPAAVDRLLRHLAEARDEDVVKMRPLELADRWRLDRRRTLALFLRATVAGLVAMSWEVLCPNCRIGKARYVTLRDLTPEAHCEACNVTFSARFDRSIEARFTVAPTLRRVPDRQFCIGGPMNTPHVVAQVEIEPGATEHLAATLAPGAYRLRVNGVPGELVIDVAATAGSAGAEAPLPATELDVRLSPDEVRPARVEVAAGPLRLAVDNATPHPRLAVLEANVWPDTAATGALIGTFQEFRDLFSTEALAPGLQLGIENLAFMFTDLSGSTGLYQRVGQARAFRMVQDHFRLLGLAIARNGGAIVKTIGDAVMATFATGTNALAAALDIQRDVRDLDVPEGVDPARLVKIGVHQGPCVAVTLNDRLDYFGTTVNTAARIEPRARGGEIVASQVACQAPGALALLERAGARRSEEIAELRGLAEPMPIVRIVPPAPTPARPSTGAGDARGDEETRRARP